MTYGFPLSLRFAKKRRITNQITSSSSNSHSAPSRSDPLFAGPSVPSPPAWESPSSPGLAVPDSVGLGVGVADSVGVISPPASPSVEPPEPESVPEEPLFDEPPLPPGLVGFGVGLVVGEVVGFGVGETVGDTVGETVGDTVTGSGWTAT